MDEVASIETPPFSSLYTGVPSPDLQRRLCETDLVVAWTVRDPRAALGGAPRVIHASPHPPPGVHAARWLLQTLELPGADPSGALTDAWPAWRAAMGITPGHVPGGPVFIHPGAGAAWKRWPPDRLAQLAGVLIRWGHDVRIVEGPADAGVVAEMQRHAETSLDVVRETSPRRLASLLSAGALFVGNDSGVTHLAAAAGVPTVALFGPTDPASWAPLGRVRVLRHCTRRTTRQGEVRVCEDPHCMETIDVGEVAATAGEPLDGQT